jgi:hypothetical protein
VSSAPSSAPKKKRKTNTTAEFKAKERARAKLNHAKKRGLKKAAAALLAETLLE